MGIEIEFNGLSLTDAIALVAEHIGGTVEHTGRYDARITNDPAGDWRVEIDFGLLKELGRRERGTEHWGEALEDTIEQLLLMVSEPLVPVEIITPPLPLTRIAEVESLIAALRTAGARGTHDHPLHAFGLQLNPELPSLETPMIVSYFKAFLLLHDWLWQRSAVDWTRRLTFFADPFATDYLRQVIDPCYWPAQDQLIDDYLAANPTRNRALDLLPLFAHLDAERVKQVVTDERVSARPTFHYRLPNSDIDNPQWGLFVPWNDWVIVERLAGERLQLDGLGQQLAVWLDRGADANDHAYHQALTTWLTPQHL